MKTFKKSDIDFILINFEYKNQIITIKAEPYRTLEYILERAINKMNKIIQLPDNISFFFLGKELNYKKSEKIGNIFNHREKVTIKIKASSTTNNNETNPERNNLRLFNNNNIINKKNNIYLLNTKKIIFPKITKEIKLPLINKENINEQKDKEKEKEKERESNNIYTTPPTLADIISFCSNNNIENFDCEYFYDYYEANGWVDMNGNKIKNWKSKIKTWYKKDVKNEELKQNKSKKKVEIIDGIRYEDGRRIL